MTPPRKGSCHCGAIQLTLLENPAAMAECNCSLCRRIGGLWHSCAPDAVEVTGACDGYIQGDRTLTNWRCRTCGCTTHWTPVDPDYGRMAINLRMFDPELRAGLPINQIDGASW